MADRVTRRATDGAWLRRQRERLGMTQVELAAALGLTANTIARMERDEMRVLPRTRLAVGAVKPKP